LAQANMGLDFVSGQYGCLFSRCRKYEYHKYLYKFILLIQCVHIYITNSMCTNLYLHSACICKTSVPLSDCVCVTLQRSLKIDPGTQKKMGMLNVIKQLQHFILCNMMCYGALKSNIGQGRSQYCFSVLHNTYIQKYKFA
jgi:hypothetical protein